MERFMTTESRIQWGTLISCSLSCFVAWLDFAIVNTALPAIETDLSASLVQLQWVMNAFILALAVFIVTLGRISDHVGRKMMNILGVSLFGFFSLLAGFSETPGWLIFCRLMQGVGSAAIIPTSLAMISHAFPGPEKGKAVGIWSGITGLGTALGPVLGGILVSTLSWRWIFFINVPFAIASVIISIYLTKESKQESATLKPDYKGCLLLTIGLSSLVFGLMHAPDWGWFEAKSLLLFATALLVLSLFCYLENRSSSPTIPFALFSSCTFVCATMVMFALVFVFTAALFLIPLYLIQLQGHPAYQAGLMMLPITASIAILSPFVGRLMSKISFKKMILTGLTFFLISTVLQLFFSTDTPFLFILVSFVFLGIGWTVARTPATTSAIASVPQHFGGTATGVLWTLQNTGGALSIAITLTIFRKISESSPSPDTFLSGYRTSMWILSAVTLTVIVTLIFYMKPKKA